MKLASLGGSDAGIEPGGWGIAETVQFLVSQGHNWKDIQDYPPHALGVFLIASQRLNKANRHNAMVEQWIAAHAGYDELMTITGQKKSPPQIDTATAKNEFMRLAADMGRIGRRST